MGTPPKLDPKNSDSRVVTLTPGDARATRAQVSGVHSISPFVTACGQIAHGDMK